MEVYIVKYELLKNDNKTERTECFTDVGDFISRVKQINTKWYIQNIETYVGKANKINKEKVLKPFEI